MERTIESVNEALEGVRSSFRLDGYDLQVVSAGPRLSVKIEALDDACEDCLAPPALMAGILSGALNGSYQAEQIEIEYPEGSAAAEH